jgi:glucosamine--fructose-6-phosphate aminotransferase (isomerizing)
MCSAFEEIKSRGADIIVITNDPSFDHKNKIVVNATNEMAEIPYVVVLQFIAYFMSIHKKINPDYPRNLAKVVTVE